MTRTNKKDIWINFAVTTEQRELIRNRAAEAGLGISEYLRRAALEGAIVLENEIGKEQWAKLGPLANNLNQYVRKIHNGEIRADDQLIIELLSLLQEIRSGLRPKYY